MSDGQSHGARADDLIKRHLASHGIGVDIVGEPPAGVDLGQILANAAAAMMGASAAALPPLTGEALEAELRDVARRYQAGAAGLFEPGDLVVPRERSNYVHHDEPVVVCGYIDAPMPPADNVVWCRYDLVVARQSKGQFVTTLVESWQFEKYERPAAKEGVGESTS